MYGFFTSLVRFFPRYFILFEPIVSGTVFLISLSVTLLLAYKFAIDYWILILCPATLMKSFISSSSFSVESLGFCMYSIMPSANKGSFTSSFLICMPFISSCLIAVARTSSTMLNKRSESRHLCLVPYFKGNAFSFYPLSMTLAVGLSYMVSIMFRYVPSLPTSLRVLIINQGWILSNAFLHLLI